MSSERALDETDGNYDQEKNKAEENAGTDRAEELGDAHPRLVNEPEQARREGRKQKQQNSRRRERPTRAAIPKLQNRAEDEEGGTYR